MPQQIITINLNSVNAYLLKEDENYVLIDTGGPIMTDKTYQNRRDTLEKALESNGCTKDNLKLIILTHGDVDHCANAKYFSRKYDAPIALHEKDVPMVTELALETFLKSCQYRSIVLKLTSKLIHKLIVKAGNAAVSHFETFTPNILFHGIESLESYGFHAQVLPIPGHTPGSIGIYTKENEFICGDLYSNNKKPAPAANAWNFSELDQSIQYVHNLSIIKFYPGHGNPFAL